MTLFFFHLNQMKIQRTTVLILSFSNSNLSNLKQHVPILMRIWKKIIYISKRLIVEPSVGHFIFTILPRPRPILADIGPLLAKLKAKILAHPRFIQEYIIESFIILNLMITMILFEESVY